MILLRDVSGHGTLTQQLPRSSNLTQKIQEVQMELEKRLEQKALGDEIFDDLVDTLFKLTV